VQNGDAKRPYPAIGAQSSGLAASMSDASVTHFAGAVQAGANNAARAPAVRVVMTSGFRCGVGPTIARAAAPEARSKREHVVSVTRAGRRSAEERVEAGRLGRLRRVAVQAGPRRMRQLRLSCEDLSSTFRP